MLLLNTLINCVNRMKKHLAISSFFLLFTLVIMAQSKKEILISGRFDNLLLPEFFQQIESQSPCFFYYDAAQLDSTSINLVVQNETLSSVLTKVFHNTGLQFSIDRDNRIYVTKGIKIVTTLPEG